MSENRARLIRVRVSEEEHRTITARAKRTHCFSLSEYVRRMALHGKIEVRQSREMDGEILDQLRRLGVNLNQMTRQFHETGQRQASTLDPDSESYGNESAPWPVD
jgi:hypothetical protein